MDTCHTLWCNDAVLKNVLIFSMHYRFEVMLNHR